MVTKIEKSLKYRENYLKQEFGFVKEQNIADFKEYYRQLLMSYRLQFEKKKDDIEKKHSKKYKHIRKSYTEKYKKMLDLEKIKLEEKLSEKQNSSVSDEDNFKEP